MINREIRLYLHVLQYQEHRPFVEVMQIKATISRRRPDAAFQLWQINCSVRRSEEPRFALVAGPFRQLVEDIHHSHAVEDVTARLERYRDLRRRTEIEKRGKG